MKRPSDKTMHLNLRSHAAVSKERFSKSVEIHKENSERKLNVNSETFRFEGHRTKVQSETFPNKDGTLSMWSL